MVVSVGYRGYLKHRLRSGISSLCICKVVVVDSPMHMVNDERSTYIFSGYLCLCYHYTVHFTFCLFIGNTIFVLVGIGPHLLFSYCGLLPPLW